MIRGHGDTGTRGQGDKGNTIEGTSGQGDTGTRGDEWTRRSRAPTNSPCNKGAGGGLAPKLVNVDHVFADAGDGYF